MMTKKEELQAQIEAYKQLLTNKDNTTLDEQFKAISDHHNERVTNAKTRENEIRRADKIS